MPEDAAVDLGAGWRGVTSGSPPSAPGAVAERSPSSAAPDGTGSFQKIQGSGRVVVLAAAAEMEWKVAAARTKRSRSLADTLLPSHEEH